MVRFVLALTFRRADVTRVKPPVGSGGETLLRRLSQLINAIPLHAWFAAFAAIFCSAIVAVFAIDALHEHTIAVSVARRAAENLAESLAQQASDTIDGADGALRTIVKQRGRDEIGQAKRQRLHETMGAFVGTMPRLHALSIIDEQGRISVSSSPTAVVGATVRDRPYFLYHRTHADLGPYLSGPARTKIDNVWVLFVTRRLDHRNGSFAGVAMAGISLGYFERSYASVDIGRSGTILLLAQDGTVVFRRPRASIGRRLKDLPLVVAPYNAQRAGWYIHAAHVDGVHRLVAFRRLDHSPLVVEVGLAENDYLADWRSSTWSGTVAVTCIVAMLCGLASVLGAQIGRRKRAEETLARLALLDSLTGLANRRQFDVMLERLWRDAARDQAPLALLLIDVDFFKAYNDLYGHQAGDKALVLIAHAIERSILRPIDLAARYGGEEFVVLLPGTDAPSAVLIAERIRGAVTALNLVHPAGAAGGFASVSIGVSAVVPPRSGLGSALVEAADTALYDAKRTGRNRTSVKLAGSLVTSDDPGRGRV